MSNYNYRWNVELQKEKAEKNLLKFVTKYVSKYSPFYRDWFAKHNIDIKEMKSIEDFKKIPPISKVEHMNNPTSFILQPHMPEWWECKFETEPLPNRVSFRYWLSSLNKEYYRSIFSKEPMRDEERIITEAAKEWLPVHFHTTTNALEPALIAYTKRDIQRNIPEIVAQIYSTGFRANYEVFNIIPSSPTVNFFQSVWAPLTVGGGTFLACDEDLTSLEKQISIANTITFEVLIGTPTLVVKWLEKAVGQLKAKKIKRITSFKLCILAGELLTKELRSQIKKLFKQIGSAPKLISSYSNNRIKVSFIECSENAGIHLNSHYFYWEILDKNTLEPISDSEEGYLCFSHIDWRGTVFLRYNTGDIVQGIQWETCEHCGLTVPKIKGSIVKEK